ncbi:Glutaredoxin-C9 [Stylosanthes scabra]|uniref:Glutaredoxin-C9 n=1 Tax=Stylosanthes scabra TaxID=79078 RepID=A0ABU6YZ22_9FABA|nr:Glutaredoxin-C9 [Stylosanthes scabra]
MHQAIPYRSWTTHFTPQPLNIIHSRTIDNNNNNNNKNNKTLSFLFSPKKDSASSDLQKMVHDMVSENAVIVIGRKGCCMSHVVKRLLLGLGVNPAVYEVEDKDEEGVARELEAIGGGGGGSGNKVQFPAVFIGGKLFGGLDRVMATHISGELVPILKQAGALWL